MGESRCRDVLGLIRSNQDVVPERKAVRTKSDLVNRSQSKRGNIKLRAKWSDPV